MLDARVFEEGRRADRFCFPPHVWHLGAHVVHAERAVGFVHENRFWLRFCLRREVLLVRVEVKDLH
ncbi:hypothetical protein ACTU45_34875, partial [Streptomyces sp. 24-1644]|uniref:hypothetical protein n=1 Tax=Streptomyces sp. 24-1644 TaxID=3457315 RepID=UPI003FA77899